MEGLGGRCGVQDRSDGRSGACFWFSIPYKPDETLKEVVCVKRAMSEVKRSISGDRGQGCIVGRSFSRECHDSGSVNVTSAMLRKTNGGGGNSAKAVRCTSPKAAMPHLKILLVDDSVMIRKTTSRTLTKEGHEVEVAQHGAECLKILEASKLASADAGRFPFDLILMDLQMPVMDGLEATERIRALEHSMKPADNEEVGQVELPHIVIIGISAAANTAGEAAEECLASGMDGFIEKPLRMKVLQEYYSKLWL